MSKIRTVKNHVWKVYNNTVWMYFRHSVMSSSYVTPWTAFFGPWDFPVKDNEMCCYFILQGIFPIQALTPVFCIGRRILYH